MKRPIFILLLIALSLFFLWTGYLWKFFSSGFAGSYPAVETWSLPVSEEKLIEIIKQIKTEHPELQPPLDTEQTTGRTKNWDSTELVQPVDWSLMSPQYSYWYFITFYYSDTNENVYTWIRPNNDTTSTTIALIALATHIDSLTPIHEIKTDYKSINKDYGYFANRREISKFKDEILELIEEKIKHK
ncbi:MAG TPA: hypothetical protein VGC65_03385 [Bacteroidia bacterium]